MILRAAIVALCGLGAAIAQSDTAEASVAAAKIALAPVNCAEAGDPFGPLLCAAREKEAEWARVDRELSPELERTCDRPALTSKVKQLQDARTAADGAFSAYFQKYGEFVDEQIAVAGNGKEPFTKALEGRITKINTDRETAQKLLDSRNKELANAPAGTTPEYLVSLQRVIKSLGQQIKGLNDTVQALRDVLETRAALYAEWDTQRVAARTNLEDIRSAGDLAASRYNYLAVLQLSKCVASGGSTPTLPQAK